MYSNIQEPPQKCRFGTANYGLLLIPIMPSSHLAVDDSTTEPVDCPWIPYRAASLRRQAAAVRFPYGFTGAVASTILFSEDL